MVGALLLPPSLPPRVIAVYYTRWRIEMRYRPRQISISAGTERKRGNVSPRTNNFRRKDVPPPVISRTTRSSAICGKPAISFLFSRESRLSRRGICDTYALHAQLSQSVNPNDSSLLFRHATSKSEVSLARSRHSSRNAANVQTSRYLRRIFRALIMLRAEQSSAR